jgi:glycosyltransferase involved in cell wall biosynthesis
VRVGRPRLGMVSPYPPRRSGLAGYAGDLVGALSGELDVVVCAVDRHGLNYPDEVVAVIGPDEVADYRRAGRILAEHRVDAVLIQHDEDVYAGPGGAHVLDLAHELRRRHIPYLVTVHGVHRSSAPDWLRTLAALAQHAARVVVTSQDARQRLAALAVVSPDRVRVVPLGVAGPDQPQDLAPVRPELLDALTGPGRVLSTFGAVEPGKGIEIALAALPSIVANCPGVRYVLAGTSGGEAYGDDLRALVSECGLSDVVRFVDAYLTQAEIAALLRRTDVYLAPGLPSARTASGSLTQAVAARCPTVAGAYPYAVELLSGALRSSPIRPGRPGRRSVRRAGWLRPGRTAAGVVVPIGDVDALAGAVIGLLTHPARAAGLRAAAAAVGRRHRWSGVARQVAGLVREVVRPGAGTSLTDLVPPLRLDGVGPECPPEALIAPGGWSWDARRAVVAAELLALPPEALPPDGWTAAAEWVERSIRRLGGAPDAEVGLVLWGLGRVAGGPGVPEPLREEAEELRASRFEDLPTEPGQAAYAALGLARGSSQDEALAQMAGQLDAARLRAGRGAAWPWFTARLGVDAARLPQALIAAGRQLRDPGMVRRGLASLDWYLRRVGLAGADGFLRLPTGTTELAVDAGATVEALVEAYRATGSGYYARLARRSFDWFLGANRMAEPIYDRNRGRCQLGVRRDRAGRAGDGRPGPGGPVPPGELGVATLAYLGSALAIVAADLADLPAARLDLAPA